MKRPIALAVALGLIVVSSAATASAATRSFFRLDPSGTPYAQIGQDFSFVRATQPMAWNASGGLVGASGGVRVGDWYASILVNADGSRLFVTQIRTKIGVPTGTPAAGGSCDPLWEPTPGEYSMLCRVPFSTALGGKTYRLQQISASLNGPITQFDSYFQVKNGPRFHVGTIRVPQRGLQLDSSLYDQSSIYSATCGPFPRSEIVFGPPTFRKANGVGTNGRYVSSDMFGSCNGSAATAVQFADGAYHRLGN
ncbi:MAG: hypothetical protein WC558_05595 [Patulibacter sp.]